MATAKESDIRPILTDYLDAFGEIWRGAWSDWLVAEKGFFRCNRTRAGFVWEHAIERAHRLFEGDPRVVIRRRHETFWFLLDDRVVFRFKKGDETGLSSNLPTQAMLAFYDPEQELPGMPEVVRLDVVYVLNKLQTAIEDVRIVYREREKVVWMFSIYEGQSNVVRLPERVATDESSSKTLVRARGERSKNEAGDAT